MKTPVASTGFLTSLAKNDLSKMNISPFITGPLDVHLMPHTITSMINCRSLGKLEQMEKKHFMMKIL